MIILRFQHERFLLLDPLSGTPTYSTVRFSSNWSVSTLRLLNSSENIPPCPRAAFTSDSVIVRVSLFCWYGSYLMGVNCKAKSGLAAAACVSYLRIITATRDPLNPPTVRLTGKPTCSQSSRWIFTLLTQSTAT